MDKLIAQEKLQLKGQHKDKDHAYISYQDIRSVLHFRDQRILAIKAPAEAQLYVPDSSEGNMMHIKSEQGEIGVFICTEESDTDDSPGNPQDGAMALLPGEQYNNDHGAEHSQQKGHSKGGDDLDDVLDILEDMEMKTPPGEENHPTMNDALEGLGQEKPHMV